MKQNTMPNRLLIVVIALILLALAACAPDSTAEPTEDVQSGQPVETTVVRGPVKSISAKTWNVDGREVVVGDDAEIDTDIKVGDIVEVIGRDGDDGSTVVTRISLDRSAVELDANSNDDMANSNNDDD
ncbi:MAG: DUF5666 domain-containing protein, partial [Chloroflexota bacterium]